MAWNDATETFVAQSGQVYTAPVGTALPTGPATSLNAAFVGLGFASEDGVTVNYDREITTFPAWQSATPIRREKASESFAITIGLLQWNEETVPRALGGGSISSVSGGYKYTPAGPSAVLEERSLVLDVQDGERTMRLVIARGNAAEAIESQFNRTSMAELPFTFEALAPETGDLYNLYFSDSTAFAAGS